MRKGGVCIVTEYTQIAQIMAPTENAGIIEDTIRGYPTRELVRARATKWTIEDLDYAFSRLDELTDPTRRGNLTKWLDELCEELRTRTVEARAVAHHSEIRAQLIELKKTHWTVLPNFWLTAISALAAIVAAVLAWLALRR